LSKLSFVAEICIIVVTPFVVLASLPYLGPGEKAFPDILHTPLAALVEFFSIYPAMVLLLIFSAAIFGQAGASLRYSLNTKKLTAHVLTEKLTPGDRLEVQGELSGRLMNGYLAVTVSTPTNKERVFLFYNTDTGLGELHGKYDQEPYVFQWIVPAESPETTCNLQVELHDVYPFKLFRTAKFDDRRASWHGTTKIVHEPAEKMVMIEKITVPSSDVLRPFNSAILPLAGWICLDLRNQTGKSYTNCVGIIRTDAGRFPLYDYNNIRDKLSLGNGKLDESFSLQPESGTTLCANIIARTPAAKVRIDLGQDIIIEKEFEINSD
jgi:hypothetical protein